LFAIRKVGQWKILSGQRKTLSSQRKIWLGFQDVKIIKLKHEKEARILNNMCIMSA
jgi:hypothetical protein